MARDRLIFFMIEERGGDRRRASFEVPLSLTTSEWTTIMDAIRHAMDHLRTVQEHRIEQARRSAGPDN